MSRIGALLGVHVNLAVFDIFYQTFSLADLLTICYRGHNENF